MPLSRSNTRYVQLGFVVLLAVSSLQVGWWILDQWLYAGRLTGRLEEMYARERRAATALEEAGVSPERIVELFPEIHDDAGERLDPATLAATATERERRLNRYFWEGGFFLVVLISGMAVLARAVRQDARLRRRQQSFLAAVSHELKSPLATSRIAAETLELRDPGPEERRRLVRRVIRNLTRLESMVTNLLDTARIEEGNLALHPEPVRLPVELEPTLAAFRERAEDEGVELEVRLDEAPPVQADPEAVRTVVRNLLENAFVAVEEEERPRIVLQAGPEDGSAALVVLDNGKGFDESGAERLFEMFYRPGDELRRGGRGAGLGLYIVDALVRRTGGRVEAHSDGPGTGARFEVRWPVAETRG
ncbi:MAG: sensor histidine kinase [Acidobacteriota bacterium]